MGKRAKVLPESTRLSRRIWGKPGEIVAATTFLWAAIGSKHGLSSEADDEMLQEAYLSTADELLQLVTGAELSPVPVPGGFIHDRGLAVARTPQSGPARQEDGRNGQDDHHQSQGHSRQACGPCGSSGLHRLPGEATATWLEGCVEGLSPGGLCGPVFFGKSKELHQVYRRGLADDLALRRDDPGYSKAIEQLDEYVASSREFRSRNPLHDKLSKKLCQSAVRASTHEKFPRVDNACSGLQVPKEKISHVGSGDICGQTVGPLGELYDPIYNGKSYQDLARGCGGRVRGGVVISDVAVPARDRAGLGRNPDLINWICGLVAEGVRVIYKCHIADAAHPIVHKARLHNMEVICDSGAKKGFNPIPWIVDGNHTRNLFHKGWLQEFLDGAGMKAGQDCWTCLWRHVSLPFVIPPAVAASTYDYRERKSAGWTPDPPLLLWSYIENWQIRSQRHLPDSLQKLRLLGMRPEELEELLGEFSARDLACEYNAQRMKAC